MSKMYSVEQLRELSVIDQELLEALTAMAASGFTAPTTLDEIRVMTTGLAAQTRAGICSSDPDFEEEDRKIQTRDGVEITVRIHSKKSLSSQAKPILVYYHQGGFSSGNLDSETQTAKLWADMGGLAVSVDYRLAPENRFPTGLFDAYDALRWVASHSSELGGDASKGFIVGGASSGANFAAVLSHLWLQEGQSPPLTGVFLVNATLIAPPHKDHAIPDKYKPHFLSWKENKDSPVASADAMTFIEGHIVADSGSPLRSPFMFSSHKGLPPHYSHICGLDPLRDEELIYDAVLEEDGVKTKHDVYPGLPHGWQYFITETTFAKRFWEDAEKGLRWLLDQERK